MKHNTEKKHHIMFLWAIALIILFIFLTWPDFFKDTIIDTDYSTMLMILLYLPGFFILMSLIEILIPQQFIIKHLGKHAGFKGSMYSFLLGSLMPGPLYIGFPVAATLLKKGISRFNVALFIGGWSTFKIGEEVFELHFLGLEFMLLRLVVSIPFVILIAYIIDKLYIKEKPA